MRKLSSTSHTKNINYLDTTEAEKVLPFLFQDDKETVKEETKLMDRKKGLGGHNIKQIMPEFSLYAEVLNTAINDFKTGRDFYLMKTKYGRKQKVYTYQVLNAKNFLSAQFPEPYPALSCLWLLNLFFDQPESIQRKLLKKLNIKMY